MLQARSQDSLGNPYLNLNTGERPSSAVIALMSLFRSSFIERVDDPRAKGSGSGKGCQCEQ